jgi:hypothetical protein
MVPPSSRTPFFPASLVLVMAKSRGALKAQERGHLFDAHGRPTQRLVEATVHSRIAFQPL